MRSSLAFAAILGAAGDLAIADDASAQSFGRYGRDRSYFGLSIGDFSVRYGSGSNGYYGHRRSGPVYHPPSVHYDRVYHPEYSHWTPSRGYHTHGHYDVVPHYTPGHFDTRHGNHYHLNPRYHHGH